MKFILHTYSLYELLFPNSFIFPLLLHFYLFANRGRLYLIVDADELLNHSRLLPSFREFAR